MSNDKPDTNGGTNVGGDVSTGNDLIGRDVIRTNIFDGNVIVAIIAVLVVGIISAIIVILNSGTGADKPPILPTLEEITLAPTHTSTSTPVDTVGSSEDISVPVNPPNTPTHVPRLAIIQTPINESSTIMPQSNGQGTVDTKLSAPEANEATITPDHEITQRSAINKLTPSYTITPTGSLVSSPWITVTISGGIDFEDKALGQVGPESYCNPEYKIALYILKADLWTLVPYADSSLPIKIESGDCTWSHEIDPWEEVAAFLVKKEHIPEKSLPGSWHCPEFMPPQTQTKESPALAAVCFDKDE